jgi:hypothetical protein
MSLILDGSAGVTFPNSTVQASAGSVLQVVNATYNTQVSNTTQTFADTGLTATITPKFSNSKILVLVNQNGVTISAVNLGVAILLYRNSTSLGTVINYALYGTASGDASIGATYLDSPATTSPTTYKTQFAKTVATSGTVYVNSDNGLSTLTLMEIAG